ncbi:hypothetical protein AHiyo4_11090 [Arthrobacter sp. Hiyo4]|nr:hypothetical protein AHiyo4_11090 [Arthrobacter sp. Hiyo4]
MTGLSSSSTVLFPGRTTWARNSDSRVAMPAAAAASLASMARARARARHASGQTLNNAYDAALAEFRAKNGLDARGLSRTPAGWQNSGNKADFVPVHPRMGSNPRPSPSGPRAPFTADPRIRYPGILTAFGRRNSVGVNGVIPPFFTE